MNVSKLGAVFALVLASQASNAMTVFSDDFEDGNADGWTVSLLGGGSGSTGVSLNNGSQRAFVTQDGSGTRSLSIDLDFVAGGTLSFDVQAVANQSATDVSGDRFNAAAGVTVLFKNAFNVEQGDVSFVFATDPSLIVGNAFAIDNTINNFDIPLADWADAAMVAPGANLDTVTIRFWAQAQKGFFSPTSNATVRFDNVNLSAVPLPAPFLLLGSALAALGFFKRRTN